jgi:hypothetical protein
LADLRGDTFTVISMLRRSACRKRPASWILWEGSRVDGVSRAPLNERTPPTTQRRDLKLGTFASAGGGRRRLVAFPRGRDANCRTSRGWFGHTPLQDGPLFFSALARRGLNPTPALRSSHGRHAHVGENTETTIVAAPSSMTHRPRPVGIRRRCSNRSQLLLQRHAPVPNDASVATSLTSTSKIKPPPAHSLLVVIRASRASRLTQETPSHPRN